MNDAEQARAVAEHFPLIEYDVYPRETVIVSLFSRVIDLETFHLLLDLLPQDRRSVVMSRLGWFNVVNPLQIDQFFDLNLAIPEERRMAEVLTTLAVAEPVFAMRASRTQASHLTTLTHSEPCLLQHGHLGKHLFEPIVCSTT